MNTGRMEIGGKTGDTLSPKRKKKKMREKKFFYLDDDDDDAVSRMMMSMIEVKKNHLFTKRSKYFYHNVTDLKDL